MRIQEYSGFGMAVPNSDFTPGPPRPEFRGYGAFGGEWETWCDQHYSSPANNGKCKSQPAGPFSFAPWTDAGKFIRGLPANDDPVTAPTPTPTPGTTTTPGASGSSWLDQNKTIVLAGAGLVAVGLLAFGMKGRRKGLAGFLGYGKVYRRRKHRKARRY